jgi:hypothetical protein
MLSPRSRAGQEAVGVWHSPIRPNGVREPRHGHFGFRLELIATKGPRWCANLSDESEGQCRETLRLGFHGCGAQDPWGYPLGV